MFNNASSLISIVMPTYNRANFIAETIESIQKQSYQNWELIIVDDGSEDNTEQIIRTINDDRILFIKEERIGMEKARNKGLEKASGYFIGFMDSDDLWAPTKLEKQLKVFDDYPEACFCLTGGYEFREAGVPLVYYYKQKEGIKSGDLFVSFFRSEVVAMPQTLLFKKNCLEVIGFLKDRELAHIHFILSLASHFKGAILYDALFYRRLHDANYSTLNRIKRHYDGIKMIKSYKALLPKEIFIDCLFRSHINFGEECLKKSGRIKAMQQFIQAWKYKPSSIVPLKKIAKAILFRN